MAREEPVEEGKEGEDAVDVACSICLEAVKSGGDRATAWLQCGHEFHLDCIGSAFNAKGVMQCPNCRKVEEGNWLYANGCRSTPDFIDELIHDGDLYNHSHIESPIGGHWCPISDLARIPSLFEEGESSSAIPFRDPFGYHAIVSENQLTMSSPHPRPFVTYTQLPQPSSSNQSFEAMLDGPGYHQQWSYFSRPRDIHTHMIAASNRHHRSYSFNTHDPASHRSYSFNTHDPASHFSRIDTDGLPAVDSVFHPFVLGHGNGSRSDPTSSSALSSVPPFLRTHANLHEAFHRQNSQSVHGTSMPQPVNLRGLNPADQCVPFLITPIPLDTEGIRNRHRLWEHEAVVTHPSLDIESSAWGSFPQPNGASDRNSRMAFLLSHNGPERLSSVQAGYNQTIIPPAHILSLM